MFPLQEVISDGVAVASLCVQIYQCKMSSTTYHKLFSFYWCYSYMGTCMHNFCIISVFSDQLLVIIRRFMKILSTHGQHSKNWFDVNSERRSLPIKLFHPIHVCDRSCWNSFIVGDVFALICISCYWHQYYCYWCCWCCRCHRCCRRRRIAAAAHFSSIFCVLVYVNVHRLLFLFLYLYLVFRFSVCLSHFCFPNPFVLSLLFLSCIVFNWCVMR